jgi:hypothetical protein
VERIHSTWLHESTPYVLAIFSATGEGVCAQEVEAKSAIAKARREIIGTRLDRVFFTGASCEILRDAL